MTSEMDNILKGVVAKSITYDEDKRVIGIGTQTITPTQDGPAPLSKQGAFTVEQTLVDSVGGIELPSNDVPVVPVLPQEEVKNDVAVPVETADLSSLGSINSDVPAEEKLEEHVDNISSGLAPIFDTFEANKKQDAPLGIDLPPMDEAPLAQEPIGGVNMDLFSPINELVAENDTMIPGVAEPIQEPTGDMPITNNSEPEQVPVVEEKIVSEEQPENQNLEDLEIKLIAELNIEAKKMIETIKTYVDAVVEKKVAEKLNENKQNNIDVAYADEGPTMSL